MNFTKKVTKQFEAIYRKRTDPGEIRKLLNEKKRQIIKEDKLSSFGIYERKQRSL